ncbi:MAG: squalene/phytoene synthase family protein [Rhodospirillales bacterium]|nr:squalene/phytoene synthase family protein [Rhodospirillales bacterium]MBO6786495.1 squalene/phytoene synthase family protein [Rhodospirillales bacterium]
MTELSYCARQVRDFDNDRFLASLFADDAVREDLFALYAFNLELSKIRETVSEPMIGRMRLQFWRDAVPGLVSGTPPSHAVAEPLAAAVGRAGISEAALSQLIDARETDMDDLPPKDLAALEGYAHDTSSALMAMALRVLGEDPDGYTDLLKPAGIGVALIGLVRAIPYQASTGRVTLPADLCAKAGLDPSQPHQWPRNPDISAITGPLLAAAEGHVRDAQRAGRGLGRRALPAFLPLSLAALYLKDLKKVGGDPARHAARPPGVRRQLTVFWRSILGQP